jgi:hypothetical protein
LLCETRECIIISLNIRHNTLSEKGSLPLFFALILSIYNIELASTLL